MILRQQSKLRALKPTVSQFLSLISYSNELQPYVQQNNTELNCTQKAGLGLNSDEHNNFHSSWLEIKLRFLLHFFITIHVSTQSQIESKLIISQ